MTKLDNLSSTMTAMCIANELQTIENARRIRKESFYYYFRNR